MPRVPTSDVPRHDRLVDIFETQKLILDCTSCTIMKQNLRNEPLLELLFLVFAYSLVALGLITAHL